MDQFWTVTCSMTSAVANVMLAAASQTALAMLDWWTYPDVRLARLQGRQNQRRRNRLG